jgi:hypothetical protein
MSDMMMWLVMIPVVVMAFKWWLDAGKWLTRHRKTLKGRVERVRSAFAEDESE